VERPSSSDELETQLRRFSRCVLQGDYRGTYRAHKEIYRMGKAAIPLLRDGVLRSDFANPKYPAATRYASALVNLIRDIDEDEARSIAQYITEKGCARPLKLVLDSICSFSVTDYTGEYECSSIASCPRLVTCEPGLTDGWLMFP